MKDYGGNASVIQFRECNFSMPQRTSRVKIYPANTPMSVNFEHSQSPATIAPMNERVENQARKQDVTETDQAPGPG